MIPLAWLLVLLPWAGAALLAFLPRERVAALVNAGISAAGFLLSLLLLAEPEGVTGWTRLDALNLPLLLLSSLVGLTTAIYSIGAIAAEGLDPRRLRAFHVVFQVFMGAQALALLADNLGVLWVAIEAATLASVLMVGLHGTPAAIEAAWKFFVLCGVGIALALLGTIILTLAARPVLETGDALSWAALQAAAARCDPGVLNLAFVFLLVGYGAKAGLVPLQAWLPDAEAEGPIAISAVLSGLLLNAALLAILRAMAVVGANPATVPPGALLLAFGLASVLVAAFALWRRRDARRFFAWSSILHMGLAATGFGFGGAAGNLAGLLHMLGHSLAKSAVFFGLGAAIRLRGSQRITDLGGLCAAQPALGWALAIGIAAVAGLPPFALFASEYLLATVVAAEHAWAILPLGLGLLVAVAAKIRVLQALCFGDPAPGMAEGRVDWTSLGPVWAHLVLALLLGVALPGPLRAMLGEAAGVAG